MRPLLLLLLLLLLFSFFFWCPALAPDPGPAGSPGIARGVTLPGDVILGELGSYDFFLSIIAEVNWH